MCNKNNITYDGKVKKISRAYYKIRNPGSKYIPTYESYKIVLEMKEDIYRY